MSDFKAFQDLERQGWSDPGRVSGYVELFASASDQAIGNPMVIVSKNDLSAKTLKEFIAWAKQNSGKVSAGTAGAGSGSHIGGVYFENITGVKLQFVPYRGRFALYALDIIEEF